MIWENNWDGGSLETGDFRGQLGEAQKLYPHQGLLFLTKDPSDGSFVTKNPSDGLFAIRPGRPARTDFFFAAGRLAGPDGFIFRGRPAGRPGRIYFRYRPCQKIIPLLYFFADLSFKYSF